MPARCGGGNLDLQRGECYNPAWDAQGRRVQRSTALDHYELLVEAEFAAAHRLRDYHGNCERLHGHNWRVQAVLRGRKLDRLGMLLDFREARRLLAEAVGPLDHQCLNDLGAFREMNPTTENIARTVFDALAARLPKGVAVARVTAWESEGCGASYTAENR